MWNTCRQCLVTGHGFDLYLQTPWPSIEINGWLSKIGWLEITKNPSIFKLVAFGVPGISYHHHIIIKSLSDHIISHHIISHHIIPYHYQITSYQNSYSYHLISYHIIYHISLIHFNFSSKSKLLREPVFLDRSVRLVPRWNAPRLKPERSVSEVAPTKKIKKLGYFPWNPGCL